MQEDYALCNMCRLVTVAAMKSPGGFAHYSNVMQVFFHAARDECRLCSLMSAALSSHRRNMAKLNSIVDATPYSPDPAWSVRLWLGDLTEWKFGIEVDGDDRESFPELGLIIVVVSCFLGSVPEGSWKAGDEDQENVMHGTIEVCDQMVLPNMNSPKRLEASSSSDLSFSLLREWINECIMSHDKCKMVPMGISAGLLPPRLIDVGPDNGSRQPFLCIVGEDLKRVQHELRYTALSYCWGKHGTFWTTDSNISERRKGIALKDFPGTIRDAVLITRKLGVQYLWVDALCILQGNDQKARKDWQEHSIIMGDIYGNAFVTLGAAAATHADSGIFHERKLPRYCRIPLAINNETEYIDLCSMENRENEKAFRSHQMQPLNHRSWAFQEKALSRRFLAYQTGQMYWRCAEGTVLEDGTSVPVYSPTLSAYSTETWTSSTWQRFVGVYSTTEATFEKDKLPALSGLAKTIQEVSKDEYLAGLWKRTILDGLIWKVKSASLVRRPSQYRAPSWSWAALNGEIVWLSPWKGDPFENDFWKYEVQYIACFHDRNIKLLGSNPFGEVACGHISIRGILKAIDEMDLRKLNTDQSSIPLLSRIYLDTTDSLTATNSGTTFIRTAESQLFMLPIREAYIGCNGLVLRRSQTNKLSYRRVGLFLIRTWRRDGSTWWFDGCAEQIINIE